MKRIPIFRPGTHTSASAGTISFSEDQLRASVAAYDTSLHEAPIVVGHPKDNAPAFGWIKGLAFAEGTLEAHADQVDPAFEEMVKEGRFKKRSASFYAPEAATNPVPGVYYLRHVGFLGAAAPAVKGLPDVHFTDADADVVEFTDDYAVASIFRRLREWIIGRYGTEEADTVIPGFLVEDMEDEARRPPPDSEPEPGFTDPSKREDSTMTMTEEQIAALRAENEQLKAQAQETQDFTERKAELERREADLAKQALRAEITAIADAGRIAPAHIEPLAEFMAQLDDDAATVNFSDADGKAQQQSPRAFMRAFLAQLPKAIDYTEHAGGGSGDGQALDPEVIAGRARAYKERVRTEQARDISYTEAAAAVRSGQDQASQ